MKILHIDIETAYTVAAVWGAYEQDIATELEHEYVLGVGFQWNHKSKVEWRGLPDFPLYQREKKNDKALMEFIWKLLDEADVVVAHNGRAFDMKKLRARMLFNGLPPLKEPKIVDTKVEFKKKFSVISNKLDDLARVYLDDRKVKHSGIELWVRCMSEVYDPEAWKEMGTYCKKDVALLKRLYALIVPWMDNPPNWNLEEDRPVGCPACGFPVYVKHGLRWNNSTVQQKYRCMREGCWHVFGGKSVPRKYKEFLDAKASEDEGIATSSERRTKSPEVRKRRKVPAREKGRVRKRSQ